MFEEMTYEAILSRINEKIKTISNVDASEGSLIFTATAPEAFELAQLYLSLDDVLFEAFAPTATREFLIKRASEKGITPKDATNAIVKGNFNVNVPIGSRFSIDEFVYVVTEKISDYIYKLQCETAGTEPNKVLGDLTSLDYIDGLESAKITEILSRGTDEEDTEDFRSRYLESVRLPTTSGNSYHYKKWALEVNGVGDAKIFPLWDGAGTVKVVIVDSEKQPANEELIKNVTDYIEENRPIGALVTVSSGIQKTINVNATLVISDGYSLQTVIDNFKNSLTQYFKDIAFNTTYISYAKIGTILLSTDGVLDYSDLTINETSANIALESEEIPIAGTVELVV